MIYKKKESLAVGLKTERRFELRPAERAGGPQRQRPGGARPLWPLAFVRGGKMLVPVSTHTSLQSQ
jgi:hypothetical protein